MTIWAIRSSPTLLLPSGSGMARGAPKKWAALAPLALAAALAVSAFITYIPQKPLRVEGFAPVAHVVTAIFPQGWAFFTKSPVTPRYTVYAVDRGGYSARSDQIEIGLGNFFGLNRAYRNAQSESEWIERSLVAEDLIECKSGDTFSCFDGISSDLSLRLTSPMKSPMYCGELFVAERTPVPWTWLTLTGENVRTTQVGRIAVSC